MKNRDVLTAYVFKFSMIFLLITIAACSSGNKESRAIQSKSINEFNAAWNTGKLELLDLTVHKDYKKQEGDQIIKGVEELKVYVQSFRESMPDVVITYIEEVHDHEKAAVRFTLEGTPAESGRKFKSSGMVFFRFKDGSIVEDFGVFDQLDALKQQGYEISLPDKSSEM